MTAKLTAIRKQSAAEGNRKPHGATLAGVIQGRAEAAERHQVSDPTGRRPARPEVATTASVLEWLRASIPAVEVLILDFADASERREDATEALQALAELPRYRRTASAVIAIADRRDAGWTALCEQFRVAQKQQHEAMWPLCSFGGDVAVCVSDCEFEQETFGRIVERAQELRDLRECPWLWTPTHDDSGIADPRVADSIISTATRLVALIRGELRAHDEAGAK
jgi:hypothetical protein